MKIQLRRSNAPVNVLREAEVHYVSLVTNGANQTPFAAVKQEGPMATKLKRRTGEPVNKTDDKPVPDDVQSPPVVVSGVRKFTFAKSVFPVRDMVTKWLDDEGFVADTLSITDSTTAFEVADSSMSDDQFSSLREVSVKDGITAIVGPLGGNSTPFAAQAVPGVAEVPADDKEKPEATKSEQDGVPVKANKSTFACITKDYSWLTNDASVGSVIDSLLDYGVVPGLYEAFSIVQTAVTNALISEAPQAQVSAQIQSICNEAAQLFSGLYEVLSSLTPDDDGPSLYGAAKSDAPQTGKPTIGQVLAKSHKQIANVCSGSDLMSKAASKPEPEPENTDKGCAPGKDKACEKPSDKVGTAKPNPDDEETTEKATGPDSLGLGGTNTSEVSTVTPIVDNGPAQFGAVKSDIAALTKAVSDLAGLVTTMVAANKSVEDRLNKMENDAPSKKSVPADHREGSVKRDEPEQSFMTKAAWASLSN